MSVFYPHHRADQDAIVRAHGQFTDTVGDAVTRIQDEAYELGRQRGKKEADTELLAMVVELLDCMGGGDTEIENAGRALVAKATGSAA